jgi:hypothetical protein
MRNFLAFRTMLTPAVIQSLWVVLSLFLVLAGLFAFFSDDPAGEGTRGVGLAVAVLGPFLLRIYCELIIVIFKIYEVLGQLLEATEDQLEATEDAHAPATL